MLSVFLCENLRSICFFCSTLILTIFGLRWLGVDPAKTSAKRSVIDNQKNNNRSITVDGKEYHNVYRVIIETKEERIDLDTVYTNLTIQITGDHNGELSLTNGHVIVSGNSEDVRTVNGIVEIGNSSGRINTHSAPVIVKGICHGDISTVSGTVTVG